MSGLLLWLIQVCSYAGDCCALSGLVNRIRPSIPRALPGLVCCGPFGANCVSVSDSQNRRLAIGALRICKKVNKSLFQTWATGGWSSGFSRLKPELQLCECPFGTVSKCRIVAFRSAKVALPSRSERRHCFSRRLYSCRSLRTFPRASSLAKRGSFPPRRRGYFGAKCSTLSRTRLLHQSDKPAGVGLGAGRPSLSQARLSLQPDKPAGGGRGGGMPPVSQARLPLRSDKPAGVGLGEGRPSLSQARLSLQPDKPAGGGFTIFPAGVIRSSKTITCQDAEFRGIRKTDEHNFRLPAPPPSRAISA